MNFLGKRSDLPFSRKSDRKKEKLSKVSFTHKQNIICSQTLLEGIAHEQTIICKPLFAGHVVVCRPMKRKKNLLRMIMWIIWCDDLLSYIVSNSSPRISYIWFSYFHNVITILSRVYNEPIQRPAPTWLVSSTGRALHQYRRGQGFESRTSLIVFQAFFSQLQIKSCVYNCDDLFSYNSNHYLH